MYVCTCACIYDGQAARVETQKGQLHIKHLEERIEHLQNKLKALTAPSSKHGIKQAVSLCVRERQTDRERERERERESGYVCGCVCVCVCYNIFTYTNITQAPSTSPRSQTFPPFNPFSKTSTPNSNWLQSSLQSMNSLNPLVGSAWGAVAVPSWEPSSSPKLPLQDSPRHFLSGGARGVPLSEPSLSIASPPARAREKDEEGGRKTPLTAMLGAFPQGGLCYGPQAVQTPRRLAPRDSSASTASRDSLRSLAPAFLVRIAEREGEKVAMEEEDANRHVAGQDETALSEHQESQRSDCSSADGSSEASLEGAGQTIDLADPLQFASYAQVQGGVHAVVRSVDARKPYMCHNMTEYSRAGAKGYIYICMYVNVCACVYTHTHTHTHVYVYIGTLGWSSRASTRKPANMADCASTF